jgi:hypothetical protein
VVSSKQPVAGSSPARRAHRKHQVKPLTVDHGSPLVVVVHAVNQLPDDRARAGGEGVPDVSQVVKVNVSEPGRSERGQPHAAPEGDRDGAAFLPGASATADLAELPGYPDGIRVKAALIRNSARAPRSLGVP